MLKLPANEPVGVSDLVGSDEDINRAAQLLRQGQLVAFPTETVYGLGADATNSLALSRLYQAKGRPQNHPVIVHLYSAALLDFWARSVPQEATLLAEAFWPGPMTLILKRQNHVLDSVTGGQDTVGLRVPGHQVALKLLRQFGKGVAAPSANKFGRLSPTSKAAVEAEFGSAVSLVLDGGACQVGIESTIIDLSKDLPCILRPGMISVEQVSKVLGRPVSIGGGKEPDAQTTRAPGTLLSHYAPNTPLCLVPAAELDQAIGQLSQKGTVTALTFAASVNALWKAGLTEKRWRRAADDPESYARNLYAVLRELDSLGADWIVVERPPQTAAWLGILDRLKRAAAGTASQSE